MGDTHDSPCPPALGGQPSSRSRTPVRRSPTIGATGQQAPPFLFRLEAFAQELEYTIDSGAGEFTLTIDKPDGEDAVRWLGGGIGRLCRSSMASKP